MMLCALAYSGFLKLCIQQDKASPAAIDVLPDQTLAVVGPLHPPPLAWLHVHVLWCMSRGATRMLRVTVLRAAVQSHPSFLGSLGGCCPLKFLVPAKGYTEAAIC